MLGPEPYAARSPWSTDRAPCLPCRPGVGGEREGKSSLDSVSWERTGVDWPPPSIFLLDDFFLLCIKPLFILLRLGCGRESVGTGPPPRLRVSAGVVQTRPVYEAGRSGVGGRQGLGDEGSGLGPCRGVSPRTPCINFLAFSRLPVNGLVFILLAFRGLCFSYQSTALFARPLSEAVFRR